MKTKSKILIIGGTGHLGQWIVKASVALLHPTFLLVRPATVAAKPHLIQSLTVLGVNILQGSLEEKRSLVEAIRQVDIVISAVKGPQLSDQLNIVEAIKEAGNSQRFLPSEFGLDVDRVQALECVQKMFETKAQVRRAIERSGIPYTYVCSFTFADYFARNLGQPGHLTAPPTDKVIIYGDGHKKVSYMCEEDVGSLTVQVANDPRTLNKFVHLRFPGNVLSQNELVALWEGKIGKPLDKINLSEEEILEQVQAQPFTWENISTAMKHAIFVKGSTCNFELGPHDLEASHLYPLQSYTHMGAYLDNFAEKSIIV